VTDPAEGSTPTTPDPDDRPDDAAALSDESRRDAADTVGMMAASRGFAGHVSNESDTVRPERGPDPSVGPD
jgi:hypothetical protein